MNEKEYHYLMSTAAVQESAARVFNLALEDKTHFHIHLDKLETIADLIVTITRENYPHGNPPLHSRWRHFVIDGRDRADFLYSLPFPEVARARIDLAMISVLLDAGAGSAWQYQDRDGTIFTRSEGLAVASLDLFASGLFSHDPAHPWQVSSAGLQQLNLEKLAAGLQSTSHRPLAGLKGRWQLLQNFARLLATNHAVFEGGRPGGLYDYLRKNFGETLSASDLVGVLLLNLNTIWPGRMIGDFAMGDAWEYAPVGWVPFHKLTLWLALSLIEPLQAGNLEVINLEKLPGLAEYRNGGLFIDGGVLTVKNPQWLLQEYSPADPLIVEWRALTIALLEQLAALVRIKMAKHPHELPLVSILQGGTWQAGRRLALQRSPEGAPPLCYQSSGTVF